MSDETKFRDPDRDANGERVQVVVGDEPRTEEEVLDLFEGSKSDDFLVEEGEGGRVKLSGDLRGGKESRGRGVGHDL